MKVQHRPGTTIAHADALSRKPCAPHRRISRLDPWVDECRKDELLKFLRGTMAGEELTPPENMSLNEVLFWKKELVKNRLRVDSGEVLYQGLKVVPQGMRVSIFKAAHNHPMAGHMGIKRTYRRIRDFYFWFHMGEDIKRLKRSCLICAKNDIKRQGHGEPRRSVEVVNLPLCQWSMDFLGPLPQTRSGNRHILVVSDLVTKWIELHPTESQTAQETVTAIVDLVLRYSIPSSLLSDQGTNFMADLTQSLMKALNIRSLRTCPYHPRTDGQTERFNATLVQYLRKFVKENQEDWDEHLQFAAYAYRTSKHSVTGFSPYELVFGRKPRDPVLLVSGDDKPVKEVDKMRSAEEWRKLAFERVIADKDSRVDDIGKANYEEGDLVMLKVFNRTKLDPPYRGPYIVAEAMPPNYEIEVNGKKRVFHGEHLKLFLKRGEVDYVDTRLPEAEETVAVESSEEEEDEDQADLESSRELDTDLESSRERHDTELESSRERGDELGVQSGASVDRSSGQEASGTPAPPAGRLSSLFGFLPTATSTGRKIKKNPKYA